MDQHPGTSLDILLLPLPAFPELSVPPLPSDKQLPGGGEGNDCIWESLRKTGNTLRMHCPTILKTHYLLLKQVIHSLGCGNHS